MADRLYPSASLSLCLSLPLPPSLPPSLPQKATLGTVPSFVVVYVLGIVELERALAVKGVAGMSCETRALGMGRERHSGGLGESEKMLKEEYRSLEID